MMLIAKVGLLRAVTVMPTALERSVVDMAATCALVAPATVELAVVIVVVTLTLAAATVSETLLMSTPRRIDRPLTYP